MNTPRNGLMDRFDEIPFGLATESEFKGGGGARGFAVRRPPTARPATVRPTPPRRRPPQRRGDSGWPSPGAAYGRRPSNGNGPAMPASEFTRWVRHALNRVLGAGLPRTGPLDWRARAAIRGFQRRRGLPADGVVSPRTRAALQAALLALPPAPAAPQLISPPSVAPPPVAPSAPQPPTAEPPVAEPAAPEPPPAATPPAARPSPGQDTELAVGVGARAPAGAPAAGRPTPARWTSIFRAPDLRVGNSVHFLVDGRATFAAMHRAIRTATNNQHYIYLLGWWLSDDFPLTAAGPGVPTTIRDLFADASRRGVQIRTMLWDQFGTKNSAEVRRINALANGAAILDNHTFSKFGPVNVGAHHQKVLVVKGDQGLIAFCGGVDINPDRIPALAGRPVSGGGSASGSASGVGSSVISSSGSSGGAGNPMHDVHCRITGPSAHDLLTTFTRRWDAHPNHAAIDRAKGDLRGRREPIPSPIPPRAPTGPSGGHCAVRITRTYEPPRGSGAMREKSIRETLRLGIQNARRFIYMEDQYLVNMEAAALLNAALPRLQHVTIVIPDSPITDMPRIWEARLNFIRRLKSGPHGSKARVFVLSTPPNSPGTKARFGPHTYVHAKTWVFDDEVAVIGSANCNNRGWLHDSEVNAVIFEPANRAALTFAQRLRMTLWAEHLGVAPAAVHDGVASLRLWTAPPPSARIRLYNPTAGSDSLLKRGIPWVIIDPTAP